MYRWNCHRHDEPSRRGGQRCACPLSVLLGSLLAVPLALLGWVSGIVVIWVMPVVADTNAVMKASLCISCDYRFNQSSVPCS
mmetsp:Transcript_47601/g.113131  ORF Transcript_47601/g.113131 Transcript_47601/m.113131 type:complete len:82 (+) Transcript_47601:169-414(+)